MPFIDVHTHKLTDGDATIITNLYEDYDAAANLPLCSMGIHPWYPDRVSFDILSTYAQNSNVVAIGECGLDKLATTDWALQQTLFRQQIVLANALHKPLIIHCVRAYDETLKILEEEKTRVPVIFHGFNKKLQLAERIWQKGYYTSFGTALFHEQSAVATVLQNCPAEGFFLETDNADISIGMIYEKAAEIRKTDTDALILQLQKNFQVVFNI